MFEMRMRVSERNWAKEVSGAEELMDTRQGDGDERAAGLDGLFLLAL